MSRQPHPMPTMFEEFSHTGQWWLPEDPERKFAGKLTFVPGSEIELNLITNPPHLQGPHEQQMKILEKHAPLFLPDSVPQIYGEVLEEPYRVVLLNSKSAGSYMDTKQGWHRCRHSFHPRYLLSGHWLRPTDDSDLLRAAMSSFSSIRGWMRSESSDALKEVTSRINTGKRHLDKFIKLLFARVSSAATFLGL